MFAWRTRRQMNVVRFARIPVDVVDDERRTEGNAHLSAKSATIVNLRSKNVAAAHFSPRISFAPSFLPRSLSHIDLTSFLPSLLRRRNSKAVRVQHSIYNSVLGRSVTAVAPRGRVVQLIPNKVPASEYKSPILNTCINYLWLKNHCLGKFKFSADAQVRRFNLIMHRGWRSDHRQQFACSRRDVAQFSSSHPTN